MAEIFPSIQIDLNVLKRESQRYNALLYQHEGILSASALKIGNLASDQQRVIARFQAFFSQAKRQNADIILTPEYSCPWNCIENLLSDADAWPNGGKLWAIGAESISKDALQTFEADYLAGKANVIYHYDKSLLTETETFFDPLIYLFRARLNEEEKLTVLIQFKTHHMGIWSGGDIERNNIILGREIYVIRNSVNSISLFSLICSEAMNFQDNFTAAAAAKLQWDDLPYLILNPQVNPDPMHRLFIAFRNYVFRAERKEIIHLNWNNLSKIGNNALLRDNTSRSGMYSRSNEIELKNPVRIKQNHKNGLYYFFYGVDRHAFILNSQPHVYLIAMPPVHISGVLQPQIRRDGPEILEVSAFDAADNLIRPTVVPDHHIDYIRGLGCTNVFLLDPDSCIIEKERIACLSSGEMLDKVNRQWFEMPNLRSIRINESIEVNCRLTFAEDSQPESRRQRTIYIDAISVLNGEILPNKALYPASITDLKTEQITIGYNKIVTPGGRRMAAEDDFRYNLINQTGEPVNATVSYIGAADDEKVNHTFDQLQMIFDKDSMNRGRVVVFYKRGRDYRSRSDPDAGNFLETNDYTGPSIFK